MKKTRFAVFMATAMVCGAALASCSEYREEYIEPTATKASAQTLIYFVGDMLDLFDLTYTVGGETIVLTESNTAEVQYKGETMRLYQGENKIYTQFPVKESAKASCYFKEGVDLSAAEPTDYCFYVKVNVDNDNDNKWSSMAVDADLYSYGGGVDWPRVAQNESAMARYGKVDVAIDFEFKSAGDVAIGISR